MTAHSLREKPSLRSLDDYRLLCEEWSWSIPENYNIAADCVDKHASDPDRRDHPALVWESASGQSRRYSFGEMSEASKLPLPRDFDASLSRPACRTSNLAEPSSSNISRIERASSASSSTNKTLIILSLIFLIQAAIIRRSTNIRRSSPKLR